MAEKQLFSSSTPWESLAGYSRAVKVGPIIYIAGTSAADEHGMVQNPDDAYAQTIYILEKISYALSQFGATLEHIVRTRIYVTNIDDFDAITKAHGEIFRDILPVNILVEVSRLATPGMLVEIEADAVMHEQL